MADTNNRVVDRNLVEHSLTGHRCFAQALDGQDAAFLKLTENLEGMIKTALSSAHPHAKNIVRETGTALQKYSKVSTEPSHRVSSISAAVVCDRSGVFVVCRAVATWADRGHL